MENDNKGSDHEAQFKQTYKKITWSATKFLGSVYPDDVSSRPDGDYSDISVGIDENDNSIILDFRDGYKDKDLIAAMRLRRRTLIVFIHMLNAALQCLEPGEVDVPTP